MPPVSVDVFYPVPEGWGLCQACELLLARADLAQAPPQRGLDALPPEWQDEFERLTALVLDLASRYQGQVTIRVHDPRSLLGLAKALRHGIRRYPAFVVGGRATITGLDQDALVRAVEAAQTGILAR